MPPPSPVLLDLAEAAIAEARKAELPELVSRLSGRPHQQYARLWPGEHYRLLSALCRVRKPRCVVEVGTFLGMGALALLDGMGPGSSLVTYDVVPWREFPETLLRESDFSNDDQCSLEQRLCDLSQRGIFAEQRRVLEQADLIFVDGPKDGLFEPIFFDKLLPVIAETKPLIVVDDIRLLPMLQLWRDLDLPKLDLTSFGHWSGTGLATAQ